MFTKSVVPICKVPDVPFINGVVIPVVKVGLVPKTKAPVPVSSDITPANCAEVVAAN